MIQTNPSPSIVAMSPVLYQPSRRTSAVFSGRLRYSFMTFGPRTNSNPVSPWGNGSNVSALKQATMSGQLPAWGQ